MWQKCRRHPYSSTEPTIAWSSNHPSSSHHVEKRLSEWTFSISFIVPIHRAIVPSLGGSDINNKSLFHFLNNSPVSAIRTRLAFARNKLAVVLGTCLLTCLLITRTDWNFFHISLNIFEMLDVHIVQAYWMFCRLPGSDCSDELFLEAIWKRDWMTCIYLAPESRCIDIYFFHIFTIVILLYNFNI